MSTRVISEDIRQPLNTVLLNVIHMKFMPYILNRSSGSAWQRALRIAIPLLAICTAPIMSQGPQPPPSLPYLGPADVYRDGTLDKWDLAAFIDSWTEYHTSQTPPEDPAADIDYDDDVDHNDAAIFIREWIKHGPATAATQRHDRNTADTENTTKPAQSGTADTSNNEQ